MYEAFFGLRERPFELTPDPRFLFLSPSHQEAACNLEYGISARKGLTVLVGEVGTGKTTLVRRTLSLAEAIGTKCVFLKNPAVTPHEFYAIVGAQLGLPASASTLLATSVEAIERLLIEREARGQHAVLIIDEAQSLSDQMFEELRLLTNMESDVARLLPILLIGQPELGARLNEPSLRYLKQRVSLRCQLDALDLQGTARYIATRIVVAGGKAAEIFTRDAVEAIYVAARGLPRAVSVLCDNALMTAFAAGQRPVSRSIVTEVCRDFDCTRPVESSAATELEPTEPRLEAAPMIPVSDTVEDSGPDLFRDVQRRPGLSIFGDGRR